MVRQIFAPDPVPPCFAEFPAGLAQRPSHIRATAGDAGLIRLAELRVARRYEELRLPHTVLPQSSLHRLTGHGRMVHWVALDDVMAAIDTVAA